ncbi:MAG: hypothetical protein V4629_01775 [Pseudomonadota bacterium]
MKKILMGLLVLILSSSYSAFSANYENDASPSNKSRSSQVQKHKNTIEKNNQKSNSEKARKTKSKEKSMHTKDELTDTNQNEPADAMEIKSPTPTHEKK